MPPLQKRLLLALCATLFLAPRAWAAPELIDRIVATVDNQTILWSELNYRLRFEAEQRGLSAFVEPGRRRTRPVEPGRSNPDFVQLGLYPDFL